MGENACVIEIYNKLEAGSRPGRYYCKVVAGLSNLGLSSFLAGDRITFERTRVLYDIPLNGPGRNKALRKVRERMADDGIKLRLLEHHVLEASEKS